MPTQEITANQSPWVPPVDFDISQPISVEIYSCGGAAANGNGGTGGGGGGGGGYARWDNLLVSSVAACSAAFSGSEVSFFKDGETLCVPNGRRGDGPLHGDGGGGASATSDIPPDIDSFGGDGADGAVAGSGGGGGEAGAPDGNGNHADGRSGGAGGSGPDGGDGGVTDEGGEDGIDGGGAGGGGFDGGSGGSNLFTGKIIITYQVAAPDSGTGQIGQRRDRWRGQG